MKVAKGIFALLFYILLTVTGCLSNNTESKHNYIAHAGGVIEGHTYTNSKEAVEHAVECGIRYIELDLGLTSDSVLVAVHDWAAFREMTNTPSVITSEPLDKQQFINSKIYNKFTPLTAVDILELLNRYPDIILVTDKISAPEILNPYFEKISHRVIVECFSESDYYTLSKAGYTCFISASPAFFGIYYIKRLLRFPRRYINRYVTSFDTYDYTVHRCYGLLPPPKCEMAVYGVKDRSTADSIFSIYPNISLIYVDNIDNPLQTAE